MRLWVAEGTANGMRPWVTKFSGVLHDPRWLPAVERIYGWHHQHERYLRNEAPLARVALLHSEQTATYHAGAAPGDRAEDHMLGMYHALVESRMPFELVHEAFLTPDRLDAFKLLILPDAAALSDAQCARDPRVRRPRRQRAGDVRHLALRRAGRSGETISDSPISSACRSTAGSKGRSTIPISAWTRIPAPGGGTRCSTGWTAPRIINGVFRIAVTADADFPSPLTFVPSYPDLPMEDVYPRVRTPTRANSICAIWAGAAWCISPGTSIGPSGR